MTQQTPITLLATERIESMSFRAFLKGFAITPAKLHNKDFSLWPVKIDLVVEKISTACPSASKTHPDSAWVTFRFPGGRASYREMICTLLDANLTAESLFPGLEGVSRSIYQYAYRVDSVAPTAGVETAGEARSAYNVWRHSESTR